MPRGRTKNKKAWDPKFSQVITRWTGNLFETLLLVYRTRKSASNAACLIMADPLKAAEIERLQNQTLASRAKKVGESLPVSRDGIINRLWELASMPPGSIISGQVKAAAELAEIYRMKVKLTEDLTRELDGRTPEEIDHYAKHGAWPERQGAGAGGVSVSGSSSTSEVKPN